MELFNYYSLDECTNKKGIVKKLKELKKEGKIEFDLDGDIFKIQDIELDDEEIEELIESFDENDIFPYLEREDDSDDDDLYGYGYDDNDDY